MVTPFLYLAWVTVDHVERDRLEFVLQKAEKRNCKEDGFYENALRRMLDEEFKDDPENLITESEQYGHVSYLVQSETPEQLWKSIERCRAVARKWAAIYRINSMK